MSENLKNKFKSKRGHPYHKNIHESKQWSFDETNKLMQIWSQIDLNSFETKRCCYKQIQTKLKTFGFERNAEQIRTKIKRQLTTKKSFKSNKLIEDNLRTQKTPTNERQSNYDLLKNINNSVDICEDISEESVDSLKSDLIISSMSDTNSSESNDIFSQTNQNSFCGKPLFDRKLCSSVRSDIKQTINLSDNQKEEQLIKSIEEVSYKTDDCFKQIMSGQQQLKESIQQFNEELTRLTDSVLNNNDFDSELKKISFTEINSEANTSNLKNELRQQSLKLIIPNLNKKYSIHIDF